MVSASGSARPLRWLVVGPFSVAPDGRKFAVAGERFATVMSGLDLRATVEVPDRIGSARARSITVAFPKLTSFRIADVVLAVPELARLQALAERLAKSGTDEAIARVQSEVGAGRLVDALRGEPEPVVATEPEPEAARPEPTTPSPGAAPTDASGDPIDAIFARATTEPEAAPSAVAKKGLDAFIGAMRRGGASSATPTTDRARAQSAADTIRAVVHATASDVLEHEVVRAMEVAWRSLRMVVSAAPGADDLGIDGLDATHARTLERLPELLSGPPLSRPDLVVLTAPVSDTDTLDALARIAARHHVPIVAEIDPALAGASVHGDAPPEIPAAWAELRRRPDTAWLAVAINPPALVTEPAPASRARFGGAAAAIAAMAAASVGRSAAPGDILGRSGMLVAPAAHDAEVQGERRTIPTARFCSLSRQRELAARGVIALGSEPGRPELRLAAAPTVGGKEDDPHLPGRVLLGRAARLVRALRDELPAGAGPSALDRALAEASDTFLPKSGGAGVALRVKMEGDKVAVDGSIGAALAGAAFKFSSEV